MFQLEYPITLIEQRSFMFKIITKLFLVFSLNLIISLPLYARLVEQKELNFPVKAEKLMKGEIHYFFDILSPRKLSVQYPAAFELDSLSLIQESNVMMVLTKSVSIIDKPVGFFDQIQMTNEKYLNHVMGEQKLQKIAPSTYLITVPGENSYSYKMQSYFDADDVSTLPNSKVIRAVSAAKKLDVISQSASTIMFREFTNYSLFTEGGVSVSSYIALNENKTLVITYNMWAVKKGFADEKVLRTSILNEMNAVNELQNSFK